MASDFEPNNYRSISPRAAAQAKPSAFSSEALVYRSIDVETSSLAPFATNDPVYHAPTGAKSLTSLKDFASPFPSSVATFPGSKISLVAPSKDFGSFGGDASLPFTPSPPHAPEYLEEGFFFFARAPLSVLFPAIQRLLRDINVDFVVKEEKFKLRCTAYHVGYSSVTFVVRMYTVDAQFDQYIIEFQRRSGDVVHFCSLFKMAKQHLRTDGFVEGSPSPFESNAVHAVQVPPSCDNDVVPSSSDTTQGLRSLLHMASSQFCDVKYEAVRCLAQLSSQDGNRPALVEAGGISSLVQSMQHSTRDVERCCVSAIANLAQTDASCQEVLACGGVSILTDLAASSPVPETVRESARALIGITARLGACVVDDKMKQCVGKLISAPDPRARKFGEQLQIAVGGSDRVN